MANNITFTGVRADPDALLTTAQAAEFLNFTTEALYGWRWKGVGPCYVYISKRAVRYRRSDLLGWVESQVTEPKGGK